MVGIIVQTAILTYKQQIMPSQSQFGHWHTKYRDKYNALGDP